MLTNTPIIVNGGGSSSAAAKVTYDTVVASTGGDYTTVAAAIAAGKTRIFIRNGTYTETSWALNAATHIIGESRDGVIIDFTLSGFITMADDCQLEEFTIIKGPGNVIRALSSAANCIFFRLRFNHSAAGANNIFRLGGMQRCTIQQCLFYNVSTTLSTSWIVDSTSFTIAWIVDNYFYGYFNFAIGITQGSIFHITNNYFQSTYDQTGGANYLIDINASTNCHDCEIASNILAANTAATGQRCIRLNGMSQMVVKDNTMTLPAGTTGIVLTASTNNIIRGNMIYTGQYGISLDSTSSKNIVADNYFSYGSLGTVNDLGFANNILNNGDSVLAGTEKYHQFLKNTSGSTINAGNLVIFKTGVAAGNEVNTTTSAGNNLVYGMACEAISNNASGHIQTLGKTTALTVNGTVAIAIGDYITTFTAAGIGAKAVAGQTAIAIALEAYAVADSNGVIDALIIPPRTI